MIMALTAGIAGWNLWAQAVPAGLAAMPPAARLAWLGTLGVALALLPANRRLTRLGLRRWRLAALFLPGIGPAVFMWLVTFSGTREQGGHYGAREGAAIGVA